MSNATAFWAAGKERIASVRTPTSTISAPTTLTATTSTPTTPTFTTHNLTTSNPILPTPAISGVPPKGASEPSTQERKGLFLKSKANDHKSNGLQNGNWVVLNTPPVIKRTFWADEEDEDEEEFFAQFLAQSKQTAATSLKTETSIKEERIKELEAALATKALRVVELDDAIQERNAYIEDLENNIKRKENEIEELKEKNHAQYVEIQDLHCEVSDKDGHIKTVGARLEQAPTTEDIKSPIPDSGSSTQSDDTKVSFELINTPEAEVALPKAPQSTKSEDTMDTQKKEATPGPTFSDTTSPIFITKETLKEVPPAPKPRKLTFPIDLSKFGKKPTASPASKPSPASMTAKNGHKSPQSEAAKRSLIKTDIKPALNPSADIRTMPFAKRILFANGPDVTVKLGGVELKTLPEYILMQCSRKAMEYFTANPAATSWNFPEGSMDADIARSFLNWMDEMTYRDRVYSMTLNSSTNKDEKNLQICHTSRVLGLTNCYIGHFTKQFCNRIRAKNISYATMKLICKYAYPENDPIFECLVNNLAEKKVHGSLEDRVVANKLAAEYPVLKTKMGEIEKKIRATRKR